ncbi:MAG: hypothetical protein Q8S92_22710 [Hydrogenophaga sp.]|uniref:phage protein n=1 Tax=Hydrogenophaga sp. TaxID=1904254 RepID=UPI002733E805|nr:hypothetical protein [Hydrogenophaga sp.]MDP3351807.1 hypothetical protein [Hydrogenophaga sp.]
MSVPQYLRKASLIVGADNGNAVDLSALRFAFAVRRGDIQTPNSADIRVYNPAPNTLTAIREEFTRVVLQAGYDGNFGVIFDGQIKQVRRGRESQTDTYVDITAADGDTAYNFSVSALTLAAGSTPANELEALIRDMARNGVQRGYIPEALPGLPRSRAKVIYGMTRDKLRELAKNTSTNWSIQDGKIDLVPLTAYKPGEIPVLNSATGVLGLPEQTQDGIRLKVLLNPSLKIGQAVRLDNEAIQRFRYNLAVDQTAANNNVRDTVSLNNDGLYYVMHAEHTGDTRGQMWNTDLVCLAIDATVTPIFAPTFPIGVEYVNSIKRFG